MLSLGRLMVKKPESEFQRFASDGSEFRHCLTCAAQMVCILSPQVILRDGFLTGLGPDKTLSLEHWRRPGLNRQPPACKAGALPIELRPREKRAGNREQGTAEMHCSLFPAPCSTLLGVPGLEPGTSALSELRSNQLSYTPAAERDSVELPEVCPAMLGSFPRLPWRLPDTAKVPLVQSQMQTRQVWCNLAHPPYASSRGERFHESNTSHSGSRLAIRVE